MLNIIFMEVVNKVKKGLVSLAAIALLTLLFLFNSDSFSRTRQGASGIWLSDKKTSSHVFLRLKDTLDETSPPKLDTYLMGRPVERMYTDTGKNIVPINTETAPKRNPSGGVHNMDVLKTNELNDRGNSMINRNLRGTKIPKTQPPSFKGYPKEPLVLTNPTQLGNLTQEPKNSNLNKELKYLNRKASEHDVNTESPVKSKYHRSLPSAIIVGAKKAGTKALLSFLSAHQRIKACKREIHFFDKNWGAGPEWYRRQMPLALPSDVTLEKTPSYFVRDQAPRRIAKLIPNVKLLFIFRNPTIRALSDYSHIVAKKRKVLTKQGEEATFENAIFMNRRGEKIINVTSPIIRTGIYVFYLKRWFNYFNRTQMYFIDGTNLISKPWEELVGVQKFLKLPIHIKKTNFVFNKSKGFYCVRTMQNNSLNSNDNKHGSISCLGKNKGRRHPDISQRTRNKLDNFFKPYNEILFKLIGKRFRWTSLAV